ncbi:MAG: hypothetical protein LQ342_000970 [Letrouitia transgressa]|nr:MAG: hypothetical protein LQ342_000970 [Letrouitia transgressa]
MANRRKTEKVMIIVSSDGDRKEVGGVLLIELRCTSVSREGTEVEKSLNSTPTHHRICPACQTSLSNPDDAVSTQLNPTEDYKTSVLSGLSPSTIMECAGRGLAFWSYQATQEMSYVVHLNEGTG